MRFALSLFLVCLASFAPTKGQTVPELQTGIKPYASLHGGDVDSVNLEGGNLVLHAPLVSFPQKGILPFSFSIRYNNLNWVLKPPHCMGGLGTYGGETGCTTAQWMPKAVGVDIAWDGFYQYTPAAISDDPNQITAPDTLTDPMGAVHTLGGVNVSSLPYGENNAEETIDGSGLRYASVGEGNSWDVLDRKGIRYSRRPSDGGYTTLTGVTIVSDPDGNTITRSVSTAGVDAGWTDSVGRHIPGGNMVIATLPMANQPGVFVPMTVFFFPGDAINGTGSCPVGTTSANQWTVPSYQGTATYTFCFTSIQLKTHFHYQYQNPGNGTHTFTATEYSGSADPLTAIVLPNGQSWQFAYDSYGNLQKVTLPTGGLLATLGLSLQMQV